jgi:putrescine aminotransferase
MEKKLMDIEDALNLDREGLIENYKNHVNPALAKMFALLNFNKQFVKARGTKVWDAEGNEYLDFLGAYGALNLGHNPPEIFKAIDKVRELPNLLQASMGIMLSVAARNLSIITPGNLSHSFFSNSGTEAVEGALKLARASSGKEKIIYCENSFHGKTIGSLSVTGRVKYQKLFKPLVPMNDMIPFGDLDALKTKLKEGNIAAFIVEPIQGEGGIIVPPDGYLKGVRNLCDEFDTYLILDEIQTGFGRTGRLFACEYEGIIPDIMCFAKSLGGGVMPVGAFITKEEIWNKAYGSMETALLHTSTFGGNTFASAAAIAVMNEITKKNLSQQAEEKGKYFLDKLRLMAEKYELIKEVRGRGLMIGIEFNHVQSGMLDKISHGVLSKLAKEYLGSMVAGTLQNDYGIITAYTLNNPNVIRLEPPLIVTYEEIDRVLVALNAIFENYKGFLGMSIKNARNTLGALFN